VSEYLIRRILYLPVVLTLVAFLVFLIRYLTPGDPAVLIAGPDAAFADIERIRQELGLAEPMYVQLIVWFRNVLRGDLGNSIFFHQPVTDIIIARLEPTLLLALYALLIAVLIGIPIGVISAVKSNSLADFGAMLIALVGMSVPHFWLGLMFILLFSVHLRWFPVGGYAPLSEGWMGPIRHLTLPAIGLGLGQAALIARMMRAAMLEVLAEDYISVARAKGLLWRMVILGHALKNAFIPVATVIGLAFAALLGGALVMEIVFNLNGIGRMIVTAILRRDYPLMQGGVLFVATVAVIVNLLIDIAYVYLDPRIRYT
jgi:peptide/nickel transport system permease protein